MSELPEHGELLSIGQELLTDTAFSELHGKVTANALLGLIDHHGCPGHSDGSPCEDYERYGLILMWQAYPNGWGNVET